MEITAQTSYTIREYTIEFDGINYLYREWIEDGGTKLLDQTVEILTDAYRWSKDGKLPYNAEELLDLFADLVEKEGKLSGLPVLDMKEFEDDMNKSTL
jgi:hypothetical protein